jgi:hypothetical protein
MTDYNCLGGCDTLCNTGTGSGDYGTGDSGGDHVDCYDNDEYMREANGESCAELVARDPYACEHSLSYCSCSCDGYAAGYGTGDSGTGDTGNYTDTGMPTVIDGCPELPDGARTLKDGEAYIYMYGLEDNQDCFWIFECSGTDQVPHLEFNDFHTYVFALRGLPCALLSLTRYAH